MLNSEFEFRLFTLDTPRLRLRPFESADRPAFLSRYNRRNIDRKAMNGAFLVAKTWCKRSS